MTPPFELEMTLVDVSQRIVHVRRVVGEAAVAPTMLQLPLSFATAPRNSTFPFCVSSVRRCAFRIFSLGNSKRLALSRDINGSLVCSPEPF
jgi:hypothetical protein